jgi:cysteinyl-tRNA synthetase
LVTEDGEPVGTLAVSYLDAIDANGQEDLFYGYDRDNHPTPGDESEYLQDFLDISKNSGNTILVTDYCSTAENIDDSYAVNYAKGYISFAATHRELDNIPAYPSQPNHVNDQDITSIDQVQNFLYLINPGEYDTKESFIQASRQPTMI